MAGTNPYLLQDLYPGYQCRQRQRLPWIVRFTIIGMKYLLHCCTSYAYTDLMINNLLEFGRAVSLFVAHKSHVA